MMETDIDLILPVYNPDEGWELTVVSKYKELEVLWKHADIHLYVVNDGRQEALRKLSLIISGKIYQKFIF